MPVLIVGADTELGEAVVAALLSRQGEVRAFVSDVDSGLALKERGVKVATGDVSDASHVGGAALNTFSAVLVPEAAFDGRERSFAGDPDAVFAAWAEALREAGVRRAIWIEDGRAPGGEERLRAVVPEVAAVATTGRSATEIAAEVARLDELAEL